MKRKEFQIPKNAAASPAPAVMPESVPAQKKEAVPVKKAKRVPAKKKFQKRKKQYQHMMTLIRLVIRIVNAAGRSTSQWG